MLILFYDACKGSVITDPAKNTSYSDLDRALKTQPDQKASFIMTKILNVNSSVRTGDSVSRLSLIHI